MDNDKIETIPLDSIKDNTTKTLDEATKPLETVTKPLDKVTKTPEKVIKSDKKTTKPTTKTTKQTTKQTTKLTKQTTKLTKPNDKTDKTPDKTDITNDNTQAVPVKLEVKKPLWKQPAFLIGCAAGFTGLAYLAMLILKARSKPQIQDEIPVYVDDAEFIENEYYGEQ